MSRVLKRLILGLIQGRKRRKSAKIGNIDPDKAFYLLRPHKIILIHSSFDYKHYKGHIATLLVPRVLKRHNLCLILCYFVYYLDITVVENFFEAFD